MVLEKQVVITNDREVDANRSPAGVVVLDAFTLGDLVYLGAMLAALREQAPSMPISVVVGEIGKVFPFFESIGVRLIQLPVPWDDRQWYKRPMHTIGGLPRAARSVRSIARRSVVGDARGDLRHLAVAMLAGRRAVSTLSLSSWGRLWGRASRHIFLERRDWLWKLQDSLGLPRTPPKWPWINVPAIPPRDPAAPPTILLAPGGSVELKKWDSANWQQLAAALRTMGFRCIFVREPNQKPSVLDSEDQWSGSIEQLAGLIASVDLVVAIDSFVGHVAAAMAVPTLTLFGPQLPELWIPWGPLARHVIAEPFSCRPCNQKRCVRPGASCMDLLQLQVVKDAVEDFFSAPAAVN